MNRLRKLFACLCPALLLAVGLTRAETVFWSDNFDTNGASRWSASAAGVWKISSPTATAGPPLSSGYRTHSGADCASTQGYGYNKDARLVCNNYNGASSLVVPTADQSPRLRFWHWFNFDNALGYVEISTNSGGSWTQLSPTYQNPPGENLTGGGVWTRPYLDLSTYAGQNIQIAFHFASGVYGNGLGWFVDDVAVVTGNPVLNFPENFAAGEGDWSVDFGTWQVGKPTSGPEAAYPPATNCAATVLATNYANNVDSRLISPPIQVPASGSPTLSFMHWYNFHNALGYVEINNGSLTTTSVTNTTISTNISIVLNTNLYQFFGSLDVTYSDPFYWNPTIGDWTNDLGKALAYVNSGGYYFESGYAAIAVGGANVDYRGALLPNPPSAPTNFLQWQGMTWNPLANERDVPIGYFGTNYIYTYTTNTTVSSSQSSWTQLSPTYQNSASGWANVSLDLSAYVGQEVHIAFHFTSGGLYSAPGWYVDDINLTGPPQLIVPTTPQTNYDGQTLTVSLSATNSILPNASYTFAALSPPANMVVTGNGPASAVLTWTNIGVVDGVLTWTNNSAAPGTHNIFVKATDNSSAPLSVTNSFPLVILPPTPPILAVSSSAATYAGQPVTVTNSASNPNLPNAVYTFSLVSPINAGISLAPNGVLTWTPPTNQPSGSSTITVKVTDNSRPPLTATNSFVATVTNLWAPVLTVPANQVIYAGQPLSVTNSATNLVFASDTFTFELLAGLTDANANLDETDLAEDGILSWMTTPALKTGTYTNIIKVTDAVTKYTATSNFLVVVLRTPPPMLTVPDPTNQAIFAGQSLTVTISATNSAFPTDTFTFELLSGLSNTYAILDDSDLNPDGVLSWTTTTALRAGTYTNVVMVTEDNTQLSATNRFLIIVSNPPPPVLTMPPTQTIDAGRQLAVTISATNAAFPNAVYTFTTNAAPAGVSITAQDATDGALTWMPTAAQAINVYSISIQVADNNIPPLLATNSFLVIVAPSPPLPVSLSAPRYSRSQGFEFSFQSGSNTTWQILASTNLGATPNWLPIFTNVTGPSGLLNFTDLLATNFPQRYYRAVQP